VVIHPRIAAKKTKIKIMKRPISLTAVGMLLFSMGLAGVISDCLRSGGFAIPSCSLFNMIAGVGLLLLWRAARLYSLFVSGSALLFSLPMTVWAVFNSNKIVFQFPAVLIDDRPHAIVPLFLVVFAMTGYVTVSAWVVWVLMRRDVRELFQHKVNLPTPVSI
jgi:hypothetical protein